MTEKSISVRTLFSGTIERLQSNPTAVVIVVSVGLLVGFLDWLVLQAPLPVTNFHGVKGGQVSIRFNPTVRILSRHTVSPSSLLGMKLPWLMWVVWLNIVKTATVAAAGGYALTRFLDVPVARAPLLRYMALFVVLSIGLPRSTASGTVGIFVFLVLLLVLISVLVGLFALPGLLIRGRSFGPALKESWRRSRGHGWSVAGCIVLIGAANHLTGSIPVFGPVGTACVGVVHAGVVAAFVRRTSQPM